MKSRCGNTGSRFPLSSVRRGSHMWSPELCTINICSSNGWMGAHYPNSDSLSQSDLPIALTWIHPLPEFSLPVWFWWDTYMYFICTHQGLFWAKSLLLPPKQNRIIFLSFFPSFPTTSERLACLVLLFRDLLHALKLQFLRISSLAFSAILVFHANSFQVLVVLCPDFYYSQVTWNLEQYLDSVREEFAPEAPRRCPKILNVKRRNHSFLRLSATAQWSSNQKLAFGNWELERSSIFSLRLGNRSYDMYSFSRGGALCGGVLIIVGKARCPTGACRSVCEQASPFAEGEECIYEELVPEPHSSCYIFTNFSNWKAMGGHRTPFEPLF